jgi:CRP-like cAMP-binding protein
MNEPLVATLSRLGLFRGFDDGVLAVMVQVLKPVSVAAGQPLFRQADLGRTAFIVVSGSLRIEVEAPTQGSIVVAHVGPGETVGEIALVDPGPRTATAIAEEPVECVALTTDALKLLERRRPDLVARILLNLSRTISGRLRALDATLARAMAVAGAPGKGGAA